MGDGMPTFDISHNYMPPFLLLPKHLLLNTATRCFSPTGVAVSMFSILAMVLTLLTALMLWLS